MGFFKVISFKRMLSLVVTAIQFAALPAAAAGAAKAPVGMQGLPARSGAQPTLRYSSSTDPKAQQFVSRVFKFRPKTT